MSDKSSDSRSSDASKSSGSNVDSEIHGQKATHGESPDDESVQGPTGHKGSVDSYQGSDRSRNTNSDDRLGSYYSEPQEDVGTWDGDSDFLVASVGTIVGLGNVWRFPLLVFKNGGGAFMIPYIICTIIGGIPLFYMEVCIGQYMSRGALLAWNIVPLFQGIALTSFIVVFYNACYYNVILAWAFYYLFESFGSELPWATCGNEWNTVNCSENFNETLINELHLRYKDLHSPVEEYWQFKVLGVTDGIHNLGSIKPDLAFCLLFAWLLVYACVSNGVKTSGKVMYVTASLPYILMTILMLRNSVLEGAADGLAFYLEPDFSRIWDFQVWKDAASQVFYSTSIGLGSITVLGSYNKFHHHALSDTVKVICIDMGTSFLSGFIVFSILGHMAKRESRSIADVTETGPGLAFIAYPSAVIQMPMAPLWSSMFFIMIILLGIDSQFVEVELLVTAFLGEFPQLLKKQKKDFFRTMCCGFFCLIGLSMVTEGGMYVFMLFDNYSAGPCILLLAFLELIAISYVYGIRRFRDNVMMMAENSHGYLTQAYLMLCWTVLTPLFCLSMIVVYFYDYVELDLTYERLDGPIYHFPDWTAPLGWCMAASSAIWVPVVMIHKFVTNGANMKALKLLTVPYYLEPHQRRPQDEGEDCLYNYEPKENLDDDMEKDGTTPKLSEHNTQSKTSQRKTNQRKTTQRRGTEKSHGSQSSGSAES